MNLSALPSTVDLLIVGAGPAGIAAALEGARLGLGVLVADENPAAGGQFYRGASGGPLAGWQCSGRRTPAAAHTSTPCSALPPCMPPGRRRG